jgi:hypothetical protein
MSWRDRYIKPPQQPQQQPPQIKLVQGGEPPMAPRPPEPPAPPSSPRRRPRPLIFLIGCGLGATSLAMNLTYAVSQSALLADQLSLASASALIEALSLTMPSLALELGRSRSRVAFGFCTAIAAGAIALATWSNLDYIRQTSGDHSAERLAIADRRADLRSSIALAQTERSAIAETHSVAELTAAMARLRIQPWAAAETAGCTRPGTAEAERQCAPHRRLVEAKAAAVHRDELDTVLSQDRTSLASLPPVAPASPSTLRLILFALVPGALAGPVLMLARW